MDNTARRLAARTAIFIVVFGCVPSAFAAGGWYLLIPPRDSEQKILDSKPLSQWHQQGAYDSASECEAVKDSLTRVEHNIYSTSAADHAKDIREKEDPAVLRFDESTLETYNANVNALLTSRCIKSDDPRLGK